MIIPLGTNDWESPLTNVSRIRLHNMYLVDNPFSPDGISRVSRPTLTQYTTVGTGPVYGIWQQDGSFGGATFVVSGNGLYKLSGVISTYIGDVPGIDHAEFAGSTTEIVIVRDGAAYLSNGTTLSTIAMPGGVQVRSVACIDSVFILTVNNSQVFYWMNPGETAPDALNFASAERIPDPIEAVRVISDEIWFIGSQGPEVWRSTGNLDAPYARIAGRVYTEGCAEKHTAISSSYKGVPCLLWVTDKRAVVLCQGTPTRISNESIEEKLRSATNLRAYGFRHNRSDFYVLTTDEGSYVFDINRGSWAAWDSFGLDYFRAHLGVQSGTTVYVGDALTNAIHTLEEGLSDNGDPVVREVSGFVIHQGNQTPCWAVNVRMNVGWNPPFRVPGFEDVYEMGRVDLLYEEGGGDVIQTWTTVDQPPQIEMRWSDDMGVTWSDYIQADLGGSGEYDKDVTFRSLGFVFRPGRDFEFRFSDNARFRIDYATMNEV